MLVALQNTMQIISTWVGVRRFGSVQLGSVQFSLFHEMNDFRMKK